MSKRFSTNMISTVTNQGKVEFMIYSGTMNSERFIEFLEQLIKKKKRKLYLILDNLKVHHSKPVKKWIEEHIDDEYINCDLKQGLSMKPAPRNQEKLTQNLKEHMELLHNNPIRVKKYFNHPDIKYAA